MGNRTPRQIASRVQKFFKKLQEENLPIPGSSSLRSHNRRQRSNFKFERPSTFFPERFGIPNDLIMQEDSEEECSAPVTTVSGVEDENGELKLSFLKKIRDVKRKISLNCEEKNHNQCFSCSDCLLKGYNWFCKDCDRACTKMICSDCFTSQLLNESFEHLNHDVQNC
jgi:ZZ-type zinc finger-containing protein 3